MTMPSGDDERQRLLSLFAAQMYLGGQPATGAAQRMVGRLVNHPTGRLALQIPPLHAPAACWCARAMVESTDTSQTIRPAASASACNAVRYLLSVGVRQFLDIGSGIPTVGNVHEVAHRIDPNARIVYVDTDPIAVAHSQAILAGNDRATVIPAGPAAAGCHPRTPEDTGDA